MRKTDYKRQCEKISLSKCIGVCRLYGPVMRAYAMKLEADADVREFQCKVHMDGTEYMTDFLITTVAGQQKVLECVSSDRMKLNLSETKHEPF